MGSSPTRGSSFFLGKVTALGVLCCFALFVCLTLLASFFLPSHLSFKNMYMYMYVGETKSKCSIFRTQNTIMIRMLRVALTIKTGAAATIVQAVRLRVGGTL